MDIDKKITKTKRWLLIFAALLVIYWVVKAIINYESQKIPIPSVVVQKPKVKKVTDYVTQTGTVVAYKSVDLVARIEGFLEKQNYIDGSFVEEGRELFLIEPKPYLEKLKGAQAQLAGKKASLEYSKIEHQRQKRMYAKGATSLNNVQMWYSKQLESEAGVAKARADEELAAIDYGYTKVKSPFYGRVGRHLVDIGNLVGNGKATKLATIQMIDPIYVYFNLNELDLIKIRKALEEQNIDPSNVQQFTVQVKTQSETKYIHTGQLNFIDTSLNASTGTIEMRAILANPGYVLLPGFFVKVRIPITKPAEKIVIPESSIQHDQTGPYVFVVAKDNMVEKKRLVIGSLSGTYRVVKSGLGTADNLIVSGMHNATPGKQVVPVAKETIST